VDQIRDREILNLEKAQQNLRVQKWVAGISVLLLLVKFFAYYITRSVSILTDALESIVNVAAGFIGLYSLYVSAKPRDSDHPYGHGKAEFISAAVEGTMILTAGAIIIYKAVQRILYPAEVEQLDQGLLLVAITAALNLVLGLYCVRTGRKNDSLALISSGKHLLSDTISTAGIIAGLALLFFTGYAWIDSAVAILAALIIIYTGYRILRRSLAGIMDEADMKLLSRLVRILQDSRGENWVDMHNLRVIRYGSVLHVDAHLTVPYYLTVNEAHLEIDTMANLIRKEFGESLEIFVHTDGCMPFQCHLCSKSNCPVRYEPFRERVTWTLENVSHNKKHGEPAQTK
jgi:cation diffusion facilitator family transporter